MAGVVFRVPGHGQGIRTAWISDRTLEIKYPAGIPVLHQHDSIQHDPMEQVFVRFNPPISKSQLIYPRLPADQWPATCQAAAASTIRTLSPESRAIVRGKSEAELGELALFWGATLNMHFGVERGNTQLSDSCAAPTISTGAAIVRLVWESLQAAH
jgi:hypothetical protein